MTRFTALMQEAPDHFIAGCFMLTTPEGHRAIGIAPAYFGTDPDEGARLVEPFSQLGTVVMQQIGPMPYTLLQTILDQAAVPHRRYYMRSNFIADPGAAADVLAQCYVQTPSPHSAVIIVPFGGAVARAAAAATPFYYRDAAYSMTLLGCWEAAAEDDANIAWVRSTWDKIGPYLSEGVYVNELYDEGSDRVRSAYGPAFARLRELKRRYDPGNLFRMNQNVAP
jgi:FAD/FMN-containing dehydrogenase